MAKRKPLSENLHSVEEAGSLLLSIICGISVGSLFAAAAFVIVHAVADRGLAVAGAVAAFPVGFVAGWVAYKFRWFLRSMFD